MNWVKVMDAEALKKKGRALFRRDEHQIVLFWVNDKVYATDNRCPHEGYPLSQGSVNSNNCVLTCQWHNWKFDLANGETLKGEDQLRLYPTRLRSGQVWLDLSELPKAERERRILAGLKTAFSKRQYGRIARETARLAINGSDVFQAVREALKWSYDRFEYGFTHAYAASADWLKLAADRPHDREKRIMYLTEAVDHMAHDVLREAAYPYEGEAQPFSGPAFLQAIEDQDQERAVGLMRDALQTKLPWTELEFWFSKAALSHYMGFGHALIYVVKTGSLLEKLGEQCMENLVLPLTRYLCTATREDLLPEFKTYRGFAQREVVFGQENPTLPDGDRAFRKSVRDSMAYVLEKAPQSSPEAVYDVLLRANARNQVYFDDRLEGSYDRPVSQNVTWLSFTHGITFANAVRAQAQKFPQLWLAGLLQMACFAGRNKDFLRETFDPAPWLVKDVPAFLERALKQVEDHGLSDPIFSAHLLKSYVATGEELETCSKETKKWILAALNRFLGAPLKEKHVRRTTRQALALLERS